MCSGVSLVLVVVVGLAVLVRRGWRPAASIQLRWARSTRSGTSQLSRAASTTPTAGVRTRVSLLRFVWSGMRGDFRAIGGFAAVRVLIAGVLVLGLVLSLAPLRRHLGCVTDSRSVAFLAGAVAVPDRYRIHQMVRHTGRRHRRAGTSTRSPRSRCRRRSRRRRIGARWRLGTPLLARLFL